MKASPFFVFLTLLLSAPSPAEEVNIVAAEKVAWSQAKGFPAGVMSARVAGDPAKAAFLVLLKVPGGTVLAPHTHGSEEGGVVLSGRGVLGKGDQVDAKAGAPLSPGSHYSIPAGAPHWFSATTDCVLARFGGGAADMTLVRGP